MAALWIASLALSPMLPPVDRVHIGQVKRHAYRMADAKPVGSDEVGNPELSPSLLADAWTKQDVVKDLVDRLKGCSLHVIGHKTGAQVSTALALARRLKESRYRFLDLDVIVSQCAGGRDPKSIEAEDGTAELRKLELAVLEEAKAWPRCVLLASGPVASERESWAKLQQGLVICISSDDRECGDLWLDESDVQVDVDAEVRAPARRRAQG